MPEDFVKLGFTPPSQLERVRRSNLTEGLSFVLRQVHPLPPLMVVYHPSNLTEGLSFVLWQLSQGGGGKKLSARVADEMRQKYDPDGAMSPDEVRRAARRTP